MFPMGCGLALALFTDFRPPTQPALCNVIEARDAIRSGRVEFTETWRHGNDETEITGTGHFADGKFRVDFHSRSGWPAPKAADGTETDIYQMVFDGSNVRAVRFGEKGMRFFELRELDNTPLHMTNVRLLGFPNAPGYANDVSASVRSGELRETRVLTRPDGVMVTELAARDEQCSVRSAVFEVDPAKGWSVVRYTMDIRAPGKTKFRLVGTMTPELHGEVWFPTFSRIEQFRGEKFDWSCETVVRDAQFDLPLDPALFTWVGLGVRNNQPVASFVSSIPCWRWTDTLDVPAPRDPSKPRALRKRD